MTGGVVLRRATFADIAEIERLMVDFAGETHWPARPVEPGLRAAFRDGAEPGLRVWLAVDAAGRAVGFAVTVHAIDLGGGAGCTLSDLYVDPASRRSGVARGLVACVAAEARALGERWMEWHADADNEGAHRFYEAIGARAKLRHKPYGMDAAAMDALAAARTELTN